MEDKELGGNESFQTTGMFNTQAHVRMRAHRHARTHARTHAHIHPPPHTHTQLGIKAIIYCLLIDNKMPMLSSGDTMLMTAGATQLKTSLRLGVSFEPD